MRRGQSAFRVLFLAAFMTTVSIGAGAQSHFCDVDASGGVDAVDIQLVINAALGLIPQGACDVDASGAVNAIDIQLVINVVLGYDVGMTVPNVTGMSQEAAQAALLDAGLSLGPVTLETSDTSPVGTVVGQEPLAGSVVLSNAAVSLSVAVALVPAFSADRTFGDAVLQVGFTDQSTAEGQAITGWTWDFGDGTAVSHEQNPVHEYVAPGSFDVSLTVDAEGGSRSIVRQDFIQIADPSAAAAGAFDLSDAVVLTRTGTLPASEAMAATLLREEIQKRTGLSLSQTTEWQPTGTVIAIMSHEGEAPALGGPLPESRLEEGYRLFVEQRAGGPTVVWVLGADGRGAMYGAGRLLRLLSWTPAGQLSLADAPAIETAPEVPLRGHQIGYRNTANSYDAWDATEYEQYIRELVVFGANAVENIPLAGTASPHFPVSEATMNTIMSGLCDEYGIEYWVWTPADVDLTNPVSRAQRLAEYEAVYQGCVRLDDVFIPGGDPGSNDPAVVMPFLEEVAALLHSYWPDAGLWVSNQGFEHEENDYFFDYLATEQPAWLEGVVFGPWAKLSIAEMRARTPVQYKLRRYPDITHSVRCQYPVEHRDRALAHTLGRENPNPRPLGQAQIHDIFAQYADGFVSYSDGCHDDVNKQIWSMSGWDGDMLVGDMLLDYCRFFFGATVAEDAAAGIAALEQNEVGALSSNAGVDATLALWQGIEDVESLDDSNWRWQMCLLRAYYDMYIKARLAHESALETDAYSFLENAGTLGANAAMTSASAELAKAQTQPVRQDLKARIQQVCADLFISAGFQTSVNAPYLASGLERGAILDFVDHPVNDRLWLQAEFARIGALATEGAKLTELGRIVNWEDPGAGGFYDDLGNLSRQPHVVNQKAWAEDPGFVASTQDEFSWNSFTWRLSWQDQAQTLFNQPLQMQYDGLNATASYRLRVMYTGRFNPTMSLDADGTLIHGPYLGPRPPSMSTVQSYDIPQALTADGELSLEWSLDAGRGCQVAEVWLELR